MSHADRVSYLDGWRGTAILLVMIGHFAPFYTGKLAAAGVECFFVLSGRLMAEILIVRRQPISTFFVRRFSRLLPALFGYVLVMLVAATALVGLDRAAIGAVAALGFFHNYLAPAQVLGFFEHTWSLAVEEHSYLLLAVIAFATVRSRRTAMLVAALIGILAIANGLRLASESGHSGQYIYWRTDVRAAAIFLSFATYLWAERYFRVERSRYWALVSPAFLAIGVALLMDRSLPEYMRFAVGTGLLALAANSVDVAFAGFRKLLAWRGLVWLGLLSYSLYLWQQPFFMLTRNGLSPIAGVALAILCALASFLWVERPARSWLNARWARRLATSGSARPLPQPVTLA